MRVGVVVKGYPRLSETFIAQELHGLEQENVRLLIISLRHPTDKLTHPINDEIKADVLYLPEYLHQEPLRVLRAWWSVRRRAGYRRAWSKWWKDLKRDWTINRVRRFGQACVLAHELPPDCTWLYAHFLHTPASVARYAADMCALPWSMSAHAKDIWTSPDWEVREKLTEAEWTVTCTAFNTAHLRTLAGSDRNIDLLYHGLDLSRFPDPGDVAITDSMTDAPVRLISVGRAVEKKGYVHLLDALALLPSDLDWTFTHIGGGPLLSALQDHATKLGLDSRIEWLGPRPQHEVLEAYRASDVFVLASKITDDGDRDGLPNVLMEAQSQRLPVIATDVSAIPEIIKDSVNGRLVPAEDAYALSAVIAELVRDGDARRTLGAKGREIVETEFSHDTGIRRLADRFAPTPL